MSRSRSDAKSNSITDEELVLHIKQGNQEAFAQFYTRHQAKIYLSAYHLLKNDQDAHDAVQEVFLMIWQHPERLDEKANVIGYLYTALRNRILSNINRSKYFDHYVNSYLAFEKQSNSDTEEMVLVRDLQQILEEKIAQLPPKMREVFEMSSKDGFSNSEIAQRMNISEGTVKQHKHQALRILRSKFPRLTLFILSFI